MHSRAFRIAENESAFRLLNEKLASGRPRDTFSIICECGNESCRERIMVTRAEYEQARSDGTLFLVRRGHEQSDVEQIVSTREDHALVQKLGESGALAEERDPRS